MKRKRRRTYVKLEGRKDESGNQRHQTWLKNLGRPSRSQWTLKSFGRCGHVAACPKAAYTQDRCGHLMACSKAAYSNSIIQQVLANNFGASYARCKLQCFRAMETLGKPPFDGVTGDTPRVHPGPSLRRDTLRA